jgi:hypothetical protein
MYQIKNYTVEIDDMSYEVLGKLSDDGKHIVFKVDINGNYFDLDAKFDYQSKEEFELDCARNWNGPIFTATLNEWANKKEWQAEISKLTNGDYWMQYLRHHHTLHEDIPDLINEVKLPESKTLALHLVLFYGIVIASVLALTSPFLL